MKRRISLDCSNVSGASESSSFRLSALKVLNLNYILKGCVHVYQRPEQVYFAFDIFFYKKANHFGDFKIYENI